MPINHRRCISCRKVVHRSQLLRVVRTHPTGTVQFNKGSGRSAYLCPQLDCLNLAHKKNRLGRALRIAIPEEVYEELYKQIQG
ncbi:YlxR family protein [Leptolyngbya sp. Heron Island J]|uniref:YlxR family protein n=1 Tax=Leptolyngbya sp. Heron Island J TaxID=1385935 RepID=UPI0008FED9CB|nr:YlxR family protein [Leptolyngbya sp. Heron Island J]